MGFFNKTKSPEIPSAIMVSGEVIHEELYSSSDILEKESEQFIRECNDSLSEAEKTHVLAMKEFGFHNAKNIETQHFKIRNAEKAKEQIELIQGYKQKYPFVKFITRECIDRICEKYNLYLCDVEKFIGEIPLKNQSEIMNFRVDFEDTTVMTYLEYPSMCYSLYQQYINKCKSGNCHSLKIVAPLNQIKMDSRDRIKNRQIITDDPIVLQPVHGGYLIVTVWGKEANDPEIQNESLN